MRYFKYFASAVLTVLLLNSCGSFKGAMTDAEARREEYQTRWIGRPATDILMTYGAPDREASDGSDGTMLIYEDFKTVRNSTSKTETIGHIDPEHVKTSTESKVRYYIEFFIDSQKVCYHVRTNLSEWSFNHPFSRPWGD
ncbi:MAG: hypothetical protein IK022_03515 [Bacteroidales bacterium]|nr:hypothetical protein [Bacteroidales bacterium]